jgi:hypothetical protein
MNGFKTLFLWLIKRDSLSIGCHWKVGKFVKLIRDKRNWHYVALKVPLMACGKEQVLRFNRV